MAATEPAEVAVSVDPSRSSPAARRRARCGGFGKGIVDDAKQTVGTWWVKEMSNFSQKTVAVTFFLFFACISPAITFGALYSKFTHYWIGAVEMITATAWCGTRPHLVHPPSVHC